MAGTARGEGHESERQCAVTRDRRARQDLLRFAVDPDGNAVPDLKGRLPGRGVWVTATREILEQAITSHAFDRALRRPVKAAGDLADLVDSLLQQDAMQRLSLANKAGDVVCGFDMVSQAIKAGKVAYLVHAGDASEDGCGKLDRQFEASIRKKKTGREAIRGLNCEQLSLALGRPNVIHAALKQGGPGLKFVESMARLERYRAGSAAYEAA
jgi:predicted RNA-binding protein YlxR (DUF448 family)